MKGLFTILFFLFFFLSVSHAQEKFPQPKPGIDVSLLRDIPILEGGRKKPLDTFAIETVRTVTGREKFWGYDPLELLLSWLTQTPQWESLPILAVPFRPLAEHLQLKLADGRISPKDLLANREFQLFLQTVASKQQDGGQLSELEKNTLQLMERANLFYGITSGLGLTLLSRPSGAWGSMHVLAEKYPNLEAISASTSGEGKIAAALQGMLLAYDQGNPELFGSLAKELKELLQEQGRVTGNYATAESLAREIQLNRLKPFRLAWLGYALAFFVLLSSLWTQGNKLYAVGMALLFTTLLIHAYGFFLRVMISGRAPVTNMYETVIWVSFGIVFFALLFEAIYRARYYGVAAAALATLLLVLADTATHTLDPAIDPLVPVLRSNYWLTIHVLTITLSYAAFALALGVGHVSMGYYLLKPQASATIERLNYFLYRSIQVGVVLLAAGTILGGVWANASWGRFWGWDPKEVWALIALLGYLALLHGRFAGWIKGFGLAVGSILAFLLVVMAWYGVNFILGVGLHSYGFSSGGAKFMSIYVAIELLWVGFATIRYKILHRPAIV